MSIGSKYKVSLFLNILIVLFVLGATTMMFTGFKFMHGPDLLLNDTNIGVFKYFTVDSNIFAGIVSLIYTVSLYKLITNKKKNISFLIYILKFMSCCALAITFFVVFVYLGHIEKNGIMSLLMNSNLFFHLIIPFLCVIDFIFFTHHDKISYKHLFFGFIPIVLYSIFYMSDILLHVEKGVISPKYDWYYLFQNGIWTMCIVFPAFVVITIVISFFFIIYKKKTCKL